jgi:hypothetical protein
MHGETIKVPNYSLHRILPDALTNKTVAFTKGGEDHLLRTALSAIFWRAALHTTRQTYRHSPPSGGWRNSTAFDAAASANTRRPYNRFAQKEAGSHYTIGLILL